MLQKDHIFPKGFEIEEIFGLRAAGSDTWVMKTWPLTKFLNSHIYELSFYPQGVEIGLIIFALHAADSLIQADFENYHIWACNLAIEGSKSRAYTLFLSQGVEIELSLLYGHRFPRNIPSVWAEVLQSASWRRQHLMLL